MRPLKLTIVIIFAVRFRKRPKTGTYTKTTPLFFFEPYLQVVCTQGGYLITYKHTVKNVREREENVYEKTKTYPSFKGTYGNGLYILENSGATVTLKGGSFISNTSNLSGYYPICEYYGNTITLPAGSSFCDASGTIQPIHNYGYAKYVTSNYDATKNWKWITIK